MRKMRGRLRGKGRRPGGGAGSPGAGPKRSGLRGRLRFGEKEWGCIWTEGPRGGIQDHRRSKSLRGAKKWRQALRDGEGEGRRGNPDLPGVEVGAASSGVPAFRTVSGRGRGQGFSSSPERPMAVI